MYRQEIDEKKKTLDLWVRRKRGNRTLECSGCGLLNYVNRWMDQLKWQLLAPFKKLAAMLLKHADGIANYCKTKVRCGVVEAVNGNIRMLINRSRGYKNVRYLLLKPRRKCDEARSRR